MVGQTETHLALHDFSKKDIMSLNPYIYIYIFVIIEFKKLFFCNYWIYNNFNNKKTSTFKGDVIEY